jgi:hypothetical protein
MKAAQPIIEDHPQRFLHLAVRMIFLEEALDGHFHVSFIDVGALGGRRER